MVLLTWDLVSGRYECVGVEVRSYVPQEPGDAVSVSDVDLEAGQRRTGEGPRPMTALMLRTLPIGSIIEAGRAQTAEWYQGAAEVSERFTAEAELWRLPGRPARHDPARVAAIYTHAWQTEGSRSPTKAVAEALGISHSAAAKQVARARAIGLLPPTQRGRPQGRTDVSNQEDSE